MLAQSDTTIQRSAVETLRRMIDVKQQVKLRITIDHER